MNDADLKALISSKFVGVIPAAGLGSRLNPYAYPKELLPIVDRGEHGRQGTCDQLCSSRWISSALPEWSIATL